MHNAGLKWSLSCCDIRIKATNWAIDWPSESLASDPFHENVNKLQLVSLLIMIHEIKVIEFLDFTAVFFFCKDIIYCGIDAFKYNLLI